MAKRQCSQQLGVTVEERIGSYDKRTGPHLEASVEGVVKFSFCARVQNIELQPESYGRGLLL